MEIPRVAAAIFVIIWLTCSILAVSAQVGTPGIAPSPDSTSTVLKSLPSMLIGFVGVAISFFLLKEVA
jgi:hypothetical protein